MVFVFLHLLALANSSSNSFYAHHVRYPFRFAVVVVLAEIIAANVKTRQRPVMAGIRMDGAVGGKKGIFILPLTCTWAGRQPE